jgi:hypothetical protein
MHFQRVGCYRVTAEIVAVAREVPARAYRAFRARPAHFAPRRAGRLVVPDGGYRCQHAPVFANDWGDFWGYPKGHGRGNLVKDGEFLILGVTRTQRPKWRVI